MLSKKIYIPLLAALLLSLHSAPLQARGQTPFSKVSTVYAIKFAGFSIGTLKYLAKHDGTKFNMKSLTHVSLFGGLASFDWKWVSNNQARITSTGLRPDTYNVTFTNGGKRQIYNIAYAGNDVKELKTTPKFKYPRENIKVRAQHMKGVVDPLSAFLTPTLVRKSNGSPCDQYFKLFDGKLRFDVELKPKRTQILKSKARGAYRGKAYVCSARWKPIAGHDPGDSTNRYMAANKTIEVYMIPVDGYEEYFAPYYISFSTPFGSVTIRSVYMEITTSKNKIISMLQK